LTETSALSLSAISRDSHHVIGSNYERLTQRVTPVVWTLEGGVHSLELGSGFEEASVVDVSADGSVMGGFTRPGAEFEPFLVRGAELVRLPTGASFVGLSADGSAVAATHQSRAVRWTEATGAVELWEGEQQSAATGISDDGRVVIGDVRTERGSRAFRWDEGSGAVLLDVPEGALSRALASNSDGSVVIGETNLDSVRRITFWSDSGVETLDELPDSVGDQAVALSSDGEVFAGSSAAQAILWSRDGGLRSVREALEALGVDLSGWSLDSVVDMSGDATVLIGRGTHEGKDEAWIAWLGEPPVPVPGSGGE
jgi:probable HAF family extracellular repeat protein